MASATLPAAILDRALAALFGTGEFTGPLGDDCVDTVRESAVARVIANDRKDYLQQPGEHVDVREGRGGRDRCGGFPMLEQSFGAGVAIARCQTLKIQMPANQ